MTKLVAPHGGILKELYVSSEDAQIARESAQAYPSWDLTARQLCDLELLLNGAFSPLDGFLGEADYNRVLEEIRLSDGMLWPMPITLDVDERFASDLQRGDAIALRDPEGLLLIIGWR